MSGDVHVQFSEGLRVKFPRSTQPYLGTHEGWLYLATIIDLYSRAVIGWSLSTRINADLVCDALTMALWRRHFPTQIIVHSDRGSQYCSNDYQQLLKDHELIGSMSAKGCCYERAACLWGITLSLKVFFIH